jgi:bifunctional NMN adenylyltransferase/nudix hydrolase
MWDVAPYPVTFTTVDTLVIKSGCVLLIKRGTQLGKNQYAMPGGYLNANEGIEDGALRELKEETHIVVPPAVLKGSIKDVKVFDHPKRSLRGRIITHVHLIDLGYGPLPEVKGGDDASGAFWLPIADVFQSEEKFFEDHYDIIVNMTSKY